MRIGVNLFGAMKWIQDSLTGCIPQLLEARLTSVEPNIMFLSAFPDRERYRPGLRNAFGHMMLMDDEALEIISTLRAAGLAVSSVQVALATTFGNRIEDLIPAIVPFVEKSDIRYLVFSGKESEVEKVRPFVCGMNAVANALKGTSATVVYHNHHMELQKDRDTTVLDYVMEHCPDSMLELDTGWVYHAGEDPTAWMRKYQDRLRLLHLKDLTHGESLECPERYFCAIGTGVLPLKSILETAKNCNLDPDGILIDQDDCDHNIFEDYKTGVKNITRAWLG